MVTIFLQKPDDFNREKTVVSKVGMIEVSFPSCYSLVRLSLFCGCFRRFRVVSVCCLPQFFHLSVFV